MPRRLSLPTTIMARADAFDAFRRAARKRANAAKKATVEVTWIAALDLATKCYAHALSKFGPRPA